MISFGISSICFQLEKGPNTIPSFSNAHCSLMSEFYLFGKQNICENWTNQKAIEKNFFVQKCKALKICPLI